MNYYEPKEVTTPQSSVDNLVPIFDEGEWGYSIALMDWEGEPRLGMRWNGGTEDFTVKGEKKQKKHPGNPQSRGFSTWFIVPDDFVIPILQQALSSGKLGGGSIDKNYAEEVVKSRLTY